MVFINIEMLNPFQILLNFGSELHKSVSRVSCFYFILFIPPSLRKSSFINVILLMTQVNSWTIICFIHPDQASIKQFVRTIAAQSCSSAQTLQQLPFCKHHIIMLCLQSSSRNSGETICKLLKLHSTSLLNYPHSSVQTALVAQIVIQILYLNIITTFWFGNLFIHEDTNNKIHIVNLSPIKDCHLIMSIL